MKIGVLGHLLLGMLSFGDKTGYELTHEFEASLANVWAASHSQIYPELAKLEGAGLIRKAEAGPRGSQRYALETAGRQAVTAWLAETGPGDSPRSERVARVFFLGLLPKERAVQYLDEQRQLHERKLAEYSALAAIMPPLDNEEWRWTRIALEAGIRTESAMADWAAWAIENLGNVPPGEPGEPAG